MLEDSDDFKSLVKSGNRIKYHATSPRERDTATGSDLPQVAVLPAKTAWNAFSDSHGTGANVQWVIQTTTGDRAMDTFFDIHWAVICALSNWQTRLAVLTNNGTAFVKSCRALEVSHSLSDTVVGGRRMALNTSSRGWIDLWSGETQLWFPTADLQA